MKTYLCLLLALFIPKVYAIAPLPTHAIKTPPSAISGQETTIPSSSVREYVANQAKIYGIDPIKILWILSKESQDCQNLTGDDGNSRGCMMISSIYHPEVSKTCAMNLPCSLQWSLNFIAKNPKNMMQWSTFACKYVWFYKEAVATFGLPPKGYIAPKYCGKPL